MSYTFEIEEDYYGKIIVGFSGDGEVLEIPEGISRIGRTTYGKKPEGVFQNNESIKKIVFPSSIRFIEDLSFAGCINLESIEFNLDRGKHFLRILPEAFSGCVSLESVVLPGYVVMDDYAFKGCASLKSITFARLSELQKRLIIEPDSLNFPTFVYPNSLAECPALTEVIFENDVHAIGKYAFKGCNSLKEITLPTVRKVQENAFSGTPALKTIRTANGKFLFLFPPLGWSFSWKGDSNAEVVWNYKK